MKRPTKQRRASLRRFTNDDEVQSPRRRPRTRTAGSPSAQRKEQRRRPLVKREPTTTNRSCRADAILLRLADPDEHAREEIIR